MCMRCHAAAVAAGTIIHGGSVRLRASSPGNNASSMPNDRWRDDHDAQNGRLPLSGRLSIVGRCLEGLPAAAPHPDPVSTPP